MDTLDCLKKLVGYPSVSSSSNESISDFVAELLRDQGFECERLVYQDECGTKKVSVVAKRGSGSGGLGYFAHTDVVPADDWKDTTHGPFVPVIYDGKLYGRGSCDMKGSLACMLSAVSCLAEQEQNAPLYVTCTADEEVGFTGAADVVKRSSYYREMVDQQIPAIIGEPTELRIVHGHKGVAGFRVISHGKAGHSSTRDGLNANLAMIPFLQQMLAIYQETESDIRWQNQEFDPPTVTWNIGVNDQTPAVNITPPRSVCTVYFRPMPGINTDELFLRAQEFANEQGLEYKEEIRGNAVYTDPNSDFVRDILSLTGESESRTVSYGTDGAMFTELDNLAVCGPGSIAQAHTHDEWISLDQLEAGTQRYVQMIRHFCLP